MKKRFYNYCGEAFTTGCDIKTLTIYFMIDYLKKPIILTLYVLIIGILFVNVRVGAILLLVGICSFLIRAYNNAHDRLMNSVKTGFFLADRNDIFKRKKMFSILLRTLLRSSVVYRPDITFQEKEILGHYAWSSYDNMMMLAYLSFKKEDIIYEQSHQYISCWERNFSHLQHDDYDAIRDKLLSLVGMPEDIIPITSIPHESTLGCDIRVVECLLESDYFTAQEIPFGNDYKY